MTLIAYSLVVFAITYVIGHAKVSLPFRAAFHSTDFGRSLIGIWLLALIECNACLGFWLGLAYGYWAQHHGLEVWFPFHWSLLSLYTCGACLWLARQSGLSE